MKKSTCAGTCSCLFSAYYLEWHLRYQLARLLFRNAYREGVAKRRNPLVEPAKLSRAAEAKADAKRTPDDLTVLSLRRLPDQLAALTRNHASLPQDDQHEFHARFPPQGSPCRCPSSGIP